MKLIQESPARASVCRRAGRKMRAQRQEGSLFRTSQGETLPPAHKARGIERSDAASNNAARPILLCEKRKKSAPPTQHATDRQHNKNKNCTLLTTNQTIIVMKKVIKNAREMKTRDKMTLFIAIAVVAAMTLSHDFRPDNPYLGGSICWGDV